MSTLRVGIIGLGGIARKHCGAISTLDDVEVVAVADMIEERRQHYVGEYDIPKSYPHHTDLLKDDSIEAVGVVLGHQLHHQLVIDSCNAGKHVLVEKPMAINIQQCDEMIEAADRNGVKLMLGLSMHYYGTSLKAKEILDSGELGPVITAISYMTKNWSYPGRRPQYRSRYHGGGMWQTNGVHVVDRLTWVMGSQAVSVSASIGTRAHYQAADDSASAFIRYKNGLAGHAIAVGYANGGPCHECHVICANGTLRFCQHYEKYVKIGRDEDWEDVPFDDQEEDMHHEWGSFAKAIREDLEPPTHGHWGRHIMEILYAAEQSAITGREVLLDSGNAWNTQTSGLRINQDHGWV